MCIRDRLERAEVAGAGFINFFLKSDMVYDTLKAILNAGTEYGVQPLRARDTIQVEYVSANPTGPLHVGHGRGAAYGSALVNLLRAAGYNVQSEYYCLLYTSKNLQVVCIRFMACCTQFLYT